MSHFEKYSVYYDILYQDKDYILEANYIDELLRPYLKEQVQEQKHKPIIEFGSGSGIHADLLADKGYKVYGVDLSAGMVEKANKRKTNSLNKDKLEFVCGNIQNCDLKLQADGLISLFHVMSYQTTNSELEATLQNVRKHLKKGAPFIFDFWYAPAVLSEGPTYREKSMENEHYKVFRKSIPEHFVNANVVNVRFEVEITEIATGTKETIEEVHPMRYFSLPEIEYLLSKNGFELSDSYTWPTKDKPTQKSWGVVVIAKCC